MKSFTPEINLVCLPIFTGISVILSLLTGDLSVFIFKLNFLSRSGGFSCCLLENYQTLKQLVYMELIYQVSNLMFILNPWIK